MSYGNGEKRASQTPARLCPNPTLYTQGVPLTYHSWRQPGSQKQALLISWADANPILWAAESSVGRAEAEEEARTVTAILTNIQHRGVELRGSTAEAE